MLKVRPQPRRRPRLEQNTRCPRFTRWQCAPDPLPESGPWRLSVANRPQCGQRRCFREKARRPRRPHPAQNAGRQVSCRNPQREGATKSSAKDDGAGRRVLGSRGGIIYKCRDGADGTGGTHYRHIHITMLPSFTTALRHFHGTSYDASAARNTPSARKTAVRKTLHEKTHPRQSPRAPFGKIVPCMSRYCSPAIRRSALHLDMHDFSLLRGLLLLQMLSLEIAEHPRWSFIDFLTCQSEE